MTFDSIYRAILNIVQKKGEISNIHLANEENLLAAACHRRVQRLEKEGYIKDYVALLSQNKISVPTTVFIEIKLSAQVDEVLESFEKAVSLIPNILECHFMAGTSDYILKVVAENTDDFARIHRRHLTRLPVVA